MPLGEMGFRYAYELDATTARTTRGAPRGGSPLPGDRPGPPAL